MFADRFAGRVGGLVVHDEKEMAARTDELVARLRKLGDQLDRNPDGPMLFLEYAAGHGLDWFVEAAERLRDVPSVGSCVDVGHVGITQARAGFARAHPGLDVAAIEPSDPRLPQLADDVQAAVASALPAVLELTRSLGRIGKRFHLHLHDGHPLIPGLSDHFGFLTRCRCRSTTRAAGHWTRCTARPGCPRSCGPPPRAAAPPSPWRSTRSRAAAPSATLPACSGTGVTSPTPSG